MNDDQHDRDPGHLPADHAGHRPLPGLGPLESAIMRALWDTSQPLKVIEVSERLSYPRDPAYTTVMTVLTILCRKDLARRRRYGRAWRYAPALSCDDYLTQRVRDLVTLARDPEAVVRNALSGPERMPRPRQPLTGSAGDPAALAPVGGGRSYASSPRQFGGAPE
jgi:predicted transcriptional regulator